MYSKHPSIYTARWVKRACTIPVAETIVPARVYPACAGDQVAIQKFGPKDCSHGRRGWSDEDAKTLPNRIDIRGELMLSRVRLMDAHAGQKRAGSKRCGDGSKPAVAQLR